MVSFMHDFLRLGSSRKTVLESTFQSVNHVWAGLDSAREQEPELTDAMRELLSWPLPEEGRDAAEVLTLAGDVLDQSVAQSRPRFFAYIGSSGLEIGAIADFLAASYDINVALDSKAATLLEQQTSRWLSDFIGFPNAQGLFTSGGTVSNITGLAAARQRALPQVRSRGNYQPVAVYCSSDAHYSNTRAVELLGLGSESIRAIPIDAHRRMIPAELERAVVADIAAGVQPMAIIGSAGTTLTGAVDPLDALADIAERFGIWLHVDGAYGAPAAATSQAAPLFAGIDRADSVSLDAHKWLFVPKACSILLVRDGNALVDTFGHNAAYIPDDEDVMNPVDVTLEYSRPLRALKLWMGFITHGAEEFREAIAHNLQLAQLTYRIAEENAEFRVLADPPQLSIVPVQHVPAGMSDAREISAHNDWLCSEIVADGRVYMSSAQIDGQTWLRPCYTNFRTEASDVETMFRVIDELTQNR